MGGRLAGKIALITGAAGAFGQDMVGLFVAEGASVLATDLADSALAPLAERHGAAVVTAVLDVREESHWMAATELAQSRFGGLDVLVNNAGASWFGPSSDLDEGTYNGLFDGNVRSAYFLVAGLAPRMAERSSGASSAWPAWPAR